QESHHQPFNMLQLQSSLCFTPSFLLPGLTHNSITTTLPRSSIKTGTSIYIPTLQTYSQIKVIAAATANSASAGQDSSTVDYNTMIS
ncbi:hypothetical protein Q8G47_28045, partial [Klebsiella pneumoniae]|uniref:hypothetical protein n=1 Tax=Klebsiella pneumoniae TaxID=573 RepID=UPI0030137A03